MESSSSVLSMGKRLWHIVRVLYYMLRKSISMQKLSMDLHLLLRRSKIASKTIRSLMTFNHYHHSSSAVTNHYFSWTNTKRTSTKRKNRHHHDEAAIAKALEIVNSDFSNAESASPSSPAPVWNRKSPVVARQLRVTDSPLPVREEGGEGDSQIDKEAEEFIQWFHEQLSLQTCSSV